jgi:HK97 gp10 family phage protein
VPGILTVTHTNKGKMTNRLTILENAKANKVEIGVIREGFEAIYRNVYKDARRRTGKMRSTIDTQVTEKGGQISVGVYYSRYIEKGTRRHPAYPFFFENVFAGATMIIDEIVLAYGYGIR